MIGWRHLGGTLVVAMFALHLVGVGATHPNQPALVVRSSAYPAPACYATPVPIYAGWTYSVPVTYAYPTVMPWAVAPAVPLAVPTPAPPSRPTVEPPLNKQVQMPGADRPAPAVFEARSMHSSPTTPARDRCRVGFWNLSGRDVTVVIDGKARAIPRDRTITLDLARDFAWRVDQQPVHTERVADDKSRYEVVIR